MQMYIRYFFIFLVFLFNASGSISILLHNWRRAKTSPHDSSVKVRPEKVKGREDEVNYSICSSVQKVSGKAFKVLCV